METKSLTLFCPILSAFEFSISNLIGPAKRDIALCELPFLDHAPSKFKTLMSISIFLDLYHHRPLAFASILPCCTAIIDYFYWSVSTLLIDIGDVQFPVKASIAIRSARKCVSLDVSKYSYQSQCIDSAKSIVTKAVTTKSTVRH